MLLLRTLPNTALSRLQDEDLVLLVQQHGHQHPASEVLLLRHRAWVCRRVAWLARRRRLDGNDALDAQQEAALASIDAIAVYASKATAGQHTGQFSLIPVARCPGTPRQLLPHLAARTRPAETQRRPSPSQSSRDGWRR
jgi:hypothetical protein